MKGCPTSGLGSAEIIPRLPLECLLEAAQWPATAYEAGEAVDEGAVIQQHGSNLVVPLFSSEVEGRVLPRHVVLYGLSRVEVFQRGWELVLYRRPVHVGRFRGGLFVNPLATCLSQLADVLQVTRVHSGPKDVVGVCTSGQSLSQRAYYTEFGGPRKRDVGVALDALVVEKRVNKTKQTPVRACEGRQRVQIAARRISEGVHFFAYESEQLVGQRREWRHLCFAFLAATVGSVVLGLVVAARLK